MQKKDKKHLISKYHFLEKVAVTMPAKTAKFTIDFNSKSTSALKIWNGIEESLTGNLSLQ